MSGKLDNQDKAVSMGMKTVGVQRPMRQTGGRTAVPSAPDGKSKRAHRSAAAVMARLVTMVRPLAGYEALAIASGLVGHLCAAGITIGAGWGVLCILGLATADASPLPTVLAAMAFCAVLRGAFRYAEQACNHYIAFRVLALVRDRVFGALRRLAPAKLEGKDRGNLISLITSDIELLEVFFAHTISPAAIAVLFSLIMVVAIGSYHAALGILALVAYLVVGVVVPLVASRTSGALGLDLRNRSGAMASFMLESLRGLDELLQYGVGAVRAQEMERRTSELTGYETRLKRREACVQAATGAIVFSFDVTMLAVAALMYHGGQLDFSGVLMPVFMLMSSFGPVLALANLGVTLQGTLAAGNRVLDILDESPVVEEIPLPDFSLKERDDVLDRARGAEACGVSFSYAEGVEEQPILHDVSLAAPRGSIVGVVGRSGSGKSTLLRLFMRFWDADRGNIEVAGESVGKLPTPLLREFEAFVPQDTHIFSGSIRENVRFVRPDATDEEIEQACRKASVHDAIAALPHGYDTQAGELGDALSGGERQRLGLARAFLHDSPFMLLDEPTSNLDSLNEAVILRSLLRERAEKTILLVSHRQSTMRIADTVVSMDCGRVS